jgi:hypothetical protein
MTLEDHASENVQSMLSITSNDPVSDLQLAGRWQ